MSACPLVVLACESLHVCTVCIWRCEHARFCVEVFYALYINFHSFILLIEYPCRPPIELLRQCLALGEFTSMLDENSGLHQVAARQSKP